MRRGPSDPTPQEIEDHEATHVPFRDWCRHCVRGKGKLDAHGNIGAEEEHTIPHLSMDYCFMGQDESKTLPILVLKDHGSQAQGGVQQCCTKQGYTA